MNKLFLLLLTLLPALAHADTPPYRAYDFRPNPDFVPLPRINDTSGTGGIYQLGEVAILEGDFGLVAYGSTGYGITQSQTNPNWTNITKRFLSKYADEFDEIVIFTTFEDHGAAGALAYAVPLFQDIQNIGADVADESAAYGSMKRLHCFVNMMRWNRYESASPITNPTNFFYPVLGQEFAHRWLSFVQYTDGQGKMSAAMLGRDAAHWASTLETNASVMDGNRIVPQADGTFLIAESNARYSDLDLYVMGLMPANEVKPWFRVAGATTMTGATVDPRQPIAVGSFIKGTREDITINQVQSALGARFPDYKDAPKSFRIGFALVTAPGEKAGDVIPVARTVEDVRKTWEQKFSEYTGGRGTICTNLTTACGAPAADVVDGSIVEAGGNGNGVIEPGEPIAVTFTVANGGTADAGGISIAASGTAVTGAPAQSIATLAPSASQMVTFSGTVPKDAKCGEVLTVTAAATMNGVSYPGLASTIPGKVTALSVDFETDTSGYTVEPGSTTNGWEYGTPVQYGYPGGAGIIYQPGSGHSNSQKAWFTGLKAGNRAQFDSSLGVGGSVLYSPVYDLTKVVKPTLRYYVWFQAIDYTFPDTPNSQPVGAQLTIDVSIDGGKHWMAMDKADKLLTAWEEHSIVMDNITQLRGAKSVQLRLTVINPQPTFQVEAGFDDFQVIGFTTACDTKSGGCALGGPAAPAGGAALVAFVALLLVTLAARRGRCTPR